MLVTVHGTPAGDSATGHQVPSLESRRRTTGSSRPVADLATLIGADAPTLRQRPQPTQDHPELNNACSAQDRDKDPMCASVGKTIAADESGHACGCCGKDKKPAAEHAAPLEAMAGQRPWKRGERPQRIQPHRNPGHPQCGSMLGKVPSSAIPPPAGYSPVTMPIVKAETPRMRSGSRSKTTARSTPVERNPAKGIQDSARWPRFLAGLHHVLPSNLDAENLSDRQILDLFCGNTQKILRR